MEKEIKNQLKILIVSQYFWPEKFIINDLAIGLNEEYEIDVLTGYPNYPEGSIFSNFKKNRKKFNNLKKINIFRVPIIPRKKNKFFLFLNYVSFLITSSIYIIFFLKKKYDLVFTYQTSPVTAGICSTLLKKIKKTKHIMWVQDLWPDTIYNLKIFKSKLILKFIKKVSIYVYKNCDCLISQSDGIKKKLNRYLNKKVRIITVRNWAEADFDSLKKPYKLKYPKKKKQKL